jgi:hypothetical protein
MDYVALLKFRSSVPAAERDGALMRRASWQYPKGVRMIAEYWPVSSAVTVVTIYIYPAVAADEGLRIGPDVVGRLARLQPQT